MKYSIPKVRSTKRVLRKKCIGKANTYIKEKNSSEFPGLGG